MSTVVRHLGNVFCTTSGNALRTHTNIASLNHVERKFYRNVCYTQNLPWYINYFLSLHIYDCHKVFITGCCGVVMLSIYKYLSVILILPNWLCCCRVVVAHVVVA
jgi:hypothetical protein